MFFQHMGGWIISTVSSFTVVRTSIVDSSPSKFVWVSSSALVSNWFGMAKPTVARD